MKPITEHPYTPDLLTDTKYFWNCRTPDQLKDYYKKLGRRTDNDLNALLAIVQEEKKLATLIRTTVETMPGWASQRKACALASLVMAMKPKIILETGVFGGRSLIPMALAAQHVGLDCKIVGIDPYSQMESARNETPANAKWWQELDHEKICEEFLFYVKKFNLEKMVTLIKKPSADVDAFDCDFYHADSNHADGAVAEAEKFGAKIPVGGIVIQDDAHWAQGAPMRARDSLENMGFASPLEVYSDGDDWLALQRLK